MLGWRNKNQQRYSVALKKKKKYSVWMRITILEVYIPSFALLVTTLAISKNWDWVVNSNIVGYINVLKLFFFFLTKLMCLNLKVMFSYFRRYACYC